MCSTSGACCSRRAGGFLAVALLCFAISGGLDLVLEAVHRSATELEDGFKFLGVAELGDLPPAAGLGRRQRRAPRGRG